MDCDGMLVGLEVGALDRFRLRSMVCCWGFPVGVVGCGWVSLGAVGWGVVGWWSARFSMLGYPVSMMVVSLTITSGI